MWFYAGGVLGIFFTIILSRLFEMVSIKEEVLKKLRFTGRASNPAAGLLALMGRYSFDIMALHIFVFKMMDMVLRKIYYRDPGMDISAYPSPLSQEWWVLYLMTGVLVPLMTGVILDRVRKAVLMKRK